MRSDKLQFVDDLSEPPAIAGRPSLAIVVIAAFEEIGARPLPQVVLTRRRQTEVYRTGGTR